MEPTDKTFLTQKKITSVEGQKGIITVQRCSLENQKGAIAVLVKSMAIAPFWFSTELMYVTFSG